MTLSLIVAASQNGVIGAGGKLPWRLPADLARFKRLTMGHPILMGRKTFESIGKPLPGRTNIVISRQKDFKTPDVHLVTSLEQALSLCKSPAAELFVIGGADIYRQALPLARRIYLTRIHRNFEGDRFLFPIAPPLWNEVERQDFPPDAQNPYPYSFLVYHRAADDAHIK